MSWEFTDNSKINGYNLQICSKKMRCCRIIIFTISVPKVRFRKNDLIFKIKKFKLH